VITCAFLGVQHAAWAQPCTAVANAMNNPPTQCPGTTFTLTGSASNGQAPYTYSWSPAAGLSNPNAQNPVLTVPAASTTYTLTITDDNGCTDTDNVTVNPLPGANAALSSSNAQFTVFNGVPTFYRCGTQASALFIFDFAGAATTGATHTINWGDGSPTFTATGATWPQQNHTYNQGIYTLTYTITQGNGCNDTRTYSIFLGTNPAVGIGNPGNTAVCGPNQLVFPITGTANNPAGTIYTVTFNDGSPPVTFTHPPPPSVTHLFTISSCGTTSSNGLTTFPNSFSATIEAENPCGLSSGSVVPIYVSTPPSTDFTVSPNDTACVNTTVTFTNTSQSGAEAPTCSGTSPAIWSITPAAGWTLGSGTLGNSNGFIGANFDPGSWSPGSTSLGVVFNTPGSYTVKLLGGNVCDGDSLLRTICVESPPTAAFTLNPNPICQGQQVTTDNTSTAPNSCSIRYQWQVNQTASFCNSGNSTTFTSGTTASSFEPVIQFNSAGTYNVVLQAINSCPVVTATQPVTVVGQPQVTLAPLGPICAGQSIFPVATFQQCGGVLTTPQWTTTGGSPSSGTGTNPGGFSYANAGNYNVQVSVNNQCGPAQTTAPLVVNPTPPTANATATTTTLCAGQTIQLQATTIPNATYSWTGPNGFSSNQQNPSIPNATVAMSGTYSVTAFLGLVCAGPPSTVTITVNPAPQITITPNNPAICAGASATLTANGGSGYTWTANGQPAGSGASITVSPPTTTTYIVNGAGLGCPGTASTVVTVTTPPVVSAGPDQTFCNQPIPVQLNGTPAGGTWSGAPNVTAGGLYTPPAATGTYTLTYTYTDANGCSGSDQMQVTVTTVTSPAVTGPNITVCEGAPVLNLFAMPPGGSWSGPGVSTTGQFNPAVAGVYVFTYTAGTGTCQTSDPITVTVVANPVAGTPPDQGVCMGSTPLLLAGTPAGGVWSGPVVTPGGTFDPTLAGPGTYNLTYTFTNINGCVDTDPMTVTVYALPVVNAGNDQTFCDQPIPQQLTGTPAGGTWSGPNVTASGLFTAAGAGTFTLTYTFTDANGCTSSDQADVTVVPVSNPANAGPDVSVCVGGSAVQLNGTPAGGSWSGTPLVTAGGLFTPTTAGSYVLTYGVGTGTCITQDQVTVTVNALPIVSAGGPQELCVDGGVLNLVGAPAGGTWSGAGTSPGGAFNPVLAGVGTTPITYTFTDANGCTDSGSTFVTVNPLPIVNAGPDQLFCDQPFPQQLTGVPAGGTWSGPNISTGGLFTPNGTGVFTVTYTYTDANFCSDSDQADVTVIPVTNPANAGADVAVCVGSAAFQLTGTPGGGSWSGAPWVTTGGLFTPGAAGTYVLTYSEGSGTCVTQDQVVVTVNPLPVVDAGAPLAACFDAGVQTVAGTPAGGTWSGAGITDPVLGSFDPLVSGVGTFALSYTFTDGNGCTNSDGTTFTVNPLPVAGFANAPIACEQSPFPFTDQSSGASGWQWDFGDGTGISFTQNPLHAYADSGTYVVTQVVTTAFGCDDTTSATLIVWEMPTIAFSLAPASGCGPLTTAFTNTTTGTGVSYAWDMGNGLGSVLQDPPPMTYVASLFADTVYTPTLTATNLCGSVQAQATVTVFPTPTALFGPDLNTGCSPWTPTFSNVTIGQASSFTWDFGDGTTLATMDSLVQHTYTTGANDTTFTVTLVATNACGSDTATYDVLVQSNDVTAFFNTDTLQGCAPLTVNFTQYSIGATNWGWDFGDGNVSMQQNPAHTYTTPGSYTVQLFADNGCSYDTTTQVITVLASPAVAFTWAPDSLCAGDAFQFTNLTPNTGAITWTFGDGTTSVLSDPVHSYATAGTWTVTATVTSNLTGCVAALAQPVTVKATPVAAMAPSPASGCAPLTVQFQNSSTDSGYNAWDLGDGNSSGSPNPTHTYTLPGTYVVQLVAQNLSGCTDTAYTQVQVHPVPTAAFTHTPDSSCVAPATVQFINQSLGAVGYTWSFSNGQSSTLNDPVMSFAGPATHTIQLVAVNAFGCTDTTQGSFTVHPTPVAAFSADPQPGCDTYPVQFTNASGNTTGQWWSLGDGTTTTAFGPVHTYPAPGLYDVVLAVEGVGGCVDTLEAPAAVVIQPTPVAGFTFDTLNTLVNGFQFANTTAGASSYLWDFGDGSTSTQFAPLHLFDADGGPHTICLVATNTLGCPDTACITIEVPASPQVFAPNAFTPDGDGLNETFLPVLDGFGEWRARLYIFNRWGEVIHNASPMVPWDGTYNGKKCKTEVYVWKVVLDRYGDEREFVGHVTLIRGDY
jgi:gliding motility-associated-like protein